MCVLFGSVQSQTRKHLIQIPHPHPTSSTKRLCGATVAHLTPDQKVVGSNPAGVIFSLTFHRKSMLSMWASGVSGLDGRSIIGLVVEYIVAIDVTRVRFPDDAFCNKDIAPMLVQIFWPCQTWSIIRGRDSSVGRASD